MQIISIEPIGDAKKKKRYHIHFYLDGEGLELDMPLYIGELKHYGIEEGVVLSDDVYRDIEKNVLRSRIVIRSEYLINAKAYTVKEMRDKLAEGFYPMPLIERRIADMLSYHYLDDEDYAQRYVELNKSRKSKRFIRMELKQKGVEEQLIENALEEMEGEEDTLRRMAEKRCGNDDLSDPKIWNRHLRFFTGKGFAYDDIFAILGDMKNR